MWLQFSKKVADGSERKFAVTESKILPQYQNSLIAHFAPAGILLGSAFPKPCLCGLRRWKSLKIIFRIFQKQFRFTPCFSPISERTMRHASLHNLTLASAFTEAASRENVGPLVPGEDIRDLESSGPVASPLCLSPSVSILLPQTAGLRWRPLNICREGGAWLTAVTF